jgi:hypothetical protein
MHESDLMLPLGCSSRLIIYLMTRCSPVSIVLCTLFGSKLAFVTSDLPSFRFGDPPETKQVGPVVGLYVVF